MLPSRRRSGDPAPCSKAAPALHVRHVAPEIDLSRTSCDQTTADGLPLSRSKFNPGVWKPAIRAAGIPDDHHNGMHVLRHTYASVLLDAGESIKALSTYLGHADPDSSCGPTRISYLPGGPNAPRHRHRVR
nr:tyrosine-type recombinase/integrase [Micromonospora saelicesensis]